MCWTDIFALKILFQNEAKQTTKREAESLLDSNRNSNGSTNIQKAYYDSDWLAFHNRSIVGNSQREH
jgi:hypothetical protein